MGINFKKFNDNNNKDGNNSGGSNDFELLPDDDYKLEAEDVSTYEARTGTPMMKVQFGITDGKYKNRKVWHQFPLTEKAMVFIINYLKKIGSDLVDKENVEVQDIIGEIEGSKIIGEVGREQLDNGPINTVNKFKPLTQDSPKPSMSVDTPSDSDDIFS